MNRVSLSAAIIIAGSLIAGDSYGERPRSRGSSAPVQVDTANIQAMKKEEEQKIQALNKEEEQRKTQREYEGLDDQLRNKIYDHLEAVRTYRMDIEKKANQMTEDSRQAALKKLETSHQNYLSITHKRLDLAEQYLQKTDGTLKDWFKTEVKEFKELIQESENKHKAFVAKIKAMPVK